MHHRFKHMKSHVNFEMAKYWLHCKFWRKIVNSLFKEADMINPCAEFEYILISQSQVIQLNAMAKLQKFYSSGVSGIIQQIPANKISLTKRNVSVSKYFNKIKIFNKGIYRDLKGIIISSAYYQKLLSLFDMIF